MSISAEDLKLIAAGYTTILGVPVEPPLQKRAGGSPRIKIGVHDVFHCTYQVLYPRPQSTCPRGHVCDICLAESASPKEDEFDTALQGSASSSGDESDTALPESAFPREDVFDIVVNSITGGSTTVQVSENQTIGTIKAAVERKLNIPARDQRLWFDGKRASDHHTVSSLHIPKGGIIVVAQGDGPFEFDSNDFDERFNYDFTNMTDDGQEYVRGGKVYKRPYGWKRFAVKALRKYGGNTWLGPDGIRTQEAKGEWPVSYHGTNKEAAEKIIKTGYKIGDGDRYGRGVYSTPSLEFVEGYYAREFQYGGDTWKIAFQNRINPDPDHFEIKKKYLGKS